MERASLLLPLVILLMQSRERQCSSESEKEGVMRHTHSPHSCSDNSVTHTHK
ncbi:hypothetical protein J4Q44_G00392800, partial [Coregonus suidteri]